MQIFELETKNGRIFRVAIVNKSQKQKLFKAIADNKNKSYEVFVRTEVITNGIHDIKQFEKLADSLV